MQLDHTSVPTSSRLRAWFRARFHGVSLENGEGVISAAIVVLIMALLGAAMWGTFNSLWDRTETEIESQVNQISRD